MWVRIYGIGLILAVVMLAGAPGSAQRTYSNFPSPPQSAEQLPQAHGSRNVNLEQMERAAQQHKMQLQKDTERLSQLVNELKQDLEKTPVGTLSVDAVKKSKEVEKLAKRVRKEMEGD
jgi:Skp family chaperone for outer membrane proteins